ncbi:hypothetical protein [Myroides injenensis]|uniref:hypothetical protein n=1 Tax=Myroides injenensis TaxID=1183151 RepID=UPI0002887BCF|nr:hypothetical protein [Myroides injenensis]
MNIKYLLFILIINIASCLSQNSMGINTEFPTATLDVNGHTRIRNTESLNINKDFDIIVTDSDGYIHSVEKDIYTQDLESIVIKDLKPLSSTTFTNEAKFQSINLIITAKNPCDRVMFCSFSTNLGAFTFLNGIARDVQAVSSIKSIPGSQNAYSVTWDIVFPNVTTCSTGTGSKSDYFDFSIKQINATTFEITNLGSHSKTFNIYMEKI